MSEPVAGASPVACYVDADGRRFEYVHIEHPGSRGLGIHFSAFFGKWGDAKPYRDTFQGYFHRLKMLGSCVDHDWLFLCDSYGAFRNGTYYTGEHGDLFVERATLAIIDSVIARNSYDQTDIVTIGSSMGGTAALKFGLLREVRGIVAVGPHIDLDISAAMQERAQEVAFITSDGDWNAPHNYGVTRQIRSLVADRPSGVRLPSLFVQTCADDVGVYREQVLPLTEQWQAAGGRVTLDVRERGGHTSDYATKAILLDAVDALLADETPDVAKYQADERYAGAIVRPPLSHRIRRRLSLARKRILHT